MDNVLSTEEAQRQLNQWRIDFAEEDSFLFDPRSRFKPLLVEELPAKLRNLGLELTCQVETDGYDPQAMWAAQWQAANTLDSLSKADRVKLFRVFFGKLAPHIETAWQWLKGQPVGDAYSGICLRDPKNPKATLGMRLNWLDSLVRLAARFQPDTFDLEWLAAWAPYLSTGWDADNSIGLLLASSLETRTQKSGSRQKEGDRVFEILEQSLKREHPIGRMGNHIPIAFLAANRPEGWELIEKLLLAAQRQEGLRQAILTAAYSAHPQAFVRLLRLMVDENLVRFSSVVLALDAWFHLQWSSLSAKKLQVALESALQLFVSASDREQALEGNDAERVYIALWVIAFHDVSAAVSKAKRLLTHAAPEVRFAATSLLSIVDSSDARKALLEALKDDDKRIVNCALSGLPNETTAENEIGLFEALEAVLPNLKDEEELPAIVWPWTQETLRRAEVARMLVGSLGRRSPAKLIPWMSQLATYERSTVVRRIGELPKWDRTTRDAIIQLVGDRSADVSEAAAVALQGKRLTIGECQQIESYLTRTAVSLRNVSVTLLLSQKDTAAIASAERLLAATKNQRLAGLELLRRMADADRSRQEVMSFSAQWQVGRRILKDEQVQLEAIAAANKKIQTLDDGLGLFDPAKRSPVTLPKDRKVKPYTSTVPKLLKSLDDLVHKHRDVEVEYKTYDGSSQSGLLGLLEYEFPTPARRKSTSDLQKELPLYDDWTTWFDGRSQALRDKDGFELLRAAIYNKSRWVGEELRAYATVDPAFSSLRSLVVGADKRLKLNYGYIVGRLLDWLLLFYPPSGANDFVLDVIETLYAAVPETARKLVFDAEHRGGLLVESQPGDWRNLQCFEEWRQELCLSEINKRQTKRLWQLQHYFDEPLPGAVRRRPDVELVLAAYTQKAANLTDVAEQTIGRSEVDAYENFQMLRRLTARQLGRREKKFLQLEEIDELLHSVRERLLECELERGEAATVSTDAALCVGVFWGTDTLFELLTALGAKGFKKLRGWNAQIRDSKPATLTSLVSNTFPRDDDTPAEFAKRVKQAIKDGDFPQERLLELAFLAPQWVDHVAATMKWNGLSEGVYWYMAHMGHIWQLTDALEEVGDDDEEEDDGEIEDEFEPTERLSRFERIIRERTSLTSSERAAGAIDVSWFERVYKQLTPQRFEKLAAAAKFATTTQAAKKAEFVADVLRGRVKKKVLVEGIRKKKLKEYVRLLGLLRMASGKQREADLIDRYEVLQEYRRYANKLSSMTRPEAIRSQEIGMKNLASNAGFADPVRLEWAMEAASTKDLAAGAVVAAKDGVTLSLELTEDAMPELTVRRGAKVLKSLPAKLRKLKPFVALRERSQHLKRQASRVKQSLEQAMLRGDAFSGAELSQLADHALLWPQLQRLVLVGDGIMGYPVKRGKGLVDHSGTIEPVKKREQLRIAHPVDLFDSKSWSKWQRECFQAERIQPFKQVFRELYVVTAQEKRDKEYSSRYAGQQVNPRQAFALWGRRGWSVDEYENVFKAFHEEDLVIEVSFDRGYTTPLEVEGLTLDRIVFRKRDEMVATPISKVPVRIFSEAMRDLDLVVSVAHVGEVDPEASSSTVEMRSALLLETCKLLGIKNVKVTASNAIIKGSYGQYSVHLGSGVVHKRPGGAVCLVPVHSQHRGRLFLPFADDDPRTAEVISKTLLLARDEEIDDPILLDQIA